MPVKLTSGEIEEQDARIEIIPLIDIMFFLLAAFMLVSLSMSHFTGLDVELPTGETVTEAHVQDGQINLTVDRAGIIYLYAVAVSSSELMDRMVSGFATDPGLEVYIRGDHRASHGSIIEVLDSVRSAGIEKVSFQIDSKQ